MLKIYLNRKTVNIRYQVILTILFLLFTIAYSLESWGLSKEALIFPRILYFVISVTGLMTILESISITDNEGVMINKRFEFEKVNLSFDLKIFIIGLFLFIALLEILGTMISIVLFLIFCMYFLGVRNWVLIISISILSTLFIYGVFKLWLSIQLPSGFFLDFL